MGLLSMALGTSNPVAQYVDANKFAIHGAFAGLGSGQNISQGLSNAAQGASTGAQQDSAYGLSLADQQSRIGQIQYEQNMQTNALKLAAQGRNATAEWLAKSDNPQLRGMAPLVQSGAMTGGDVIAAMYRPGQTVKTDENLMPNPLSPDPRLSGFDGSSTGAAASSASSAGPSSAAGSPAPAPSPSPNVFTPNAPAGTSGTPAAPVASSTDYGYAPGQVGQSPAFAAGNGPSPVAAASGGPAVATSAQPTGGPAFTPSVPAPAAGAQQQSAPTPNMSIAGAVAPQQGGPQPLSIKPVYPAQSSNPLNMSIDQRKAVAAANGLKPGDPGYANFVMAGTLPASIAETWKPATAADLAAQHISGGDPSVYQISSFGQLKQVTGAISQGSDSAPLGTTGVQGIDPTTPGYTSKVVTGGLTQAAIDQKALDYLTSGTEPPVGRTGLAGAQSAAIANRMAEISPSGNLAANKAQLGALSDSLGKQRELLDTLQRSVSNAENGFAQVIKTFDGKVNPSQYPTVNAVKNAIAMHLNPGDVSAFNAGLQEVATEYTQVFSRGGQVSDGVRARAADIVNGNLSISDLGKVLSELQAQGDINIKGAQTQMNRISAQINGIISGKANPPQDNNTNAPTKTIGGVTYTQNANGEWTY